MQPQLDTERLRFVQGKLAELITLLEDETTAMPQYGQRVTIAKNHLEDAFYSLETAIKRTKGESLWEVKNGS